jgi:DNA-binding HxlR family transcriptional regulator
MNQQQSSQRSLCPLSKALELIGDKWSLLIIRDMCLGSKRYGDFQNAAEGIPTNILANRLKQLEQHGILEKKAYQSKPLRHEYLLTEKGADLLPVLQAMAHWMQKYDPTASQPPVNFYKASPQDILESLSKTNED